MFKIILGSVVVATALFGADLQSSGVEVTLENGKKATIKREAKPKECETVAFDPKDIFLTFSKKSKNQILHSTNPFIKGF